MVDIYLFLLVYFSQEFKVSYTVIRHILEACDMFCKAERTKCGDNIQNKVQVGMRGSRRGKEYVVHKNKQFLSNTGPDPLKNQAGIQPPGERHYNDGLSYPGIWVPSPFINKKPCLSWASSAKLSGSVHDW